MAKSPRSTTTTKSAGTRTRTTRPPEKPAANGAPDRDAIARRAYEIFQARGGQHGYEIEDWLQAERELTGRQDQR